MTRLVSFEDQRRSVAMLGEVTIEAVDGEVELAVGVPAAVQTGVVERPVTGGRREPAPRQPPRLLKPESIGVGPFEIVKLLEFGRANPRVEVRRYRMHSLAHALPTRPMSMTKRKRTSPFAILSHASLIWLGLICSTSGSTPCSPQKSSISCVSGKPPMSDPAIVRLRIASDPPCTP